MGTISQGPSTVSDPVLRTLVVGQRILTVSHPGIQSSSLSTLEKVGWLPLNGGGGGR
jgi:hypothetical protein